MPRDPSRPLDSIADVLLAAVSRHNDHHDDPEQDLERRRIDVEAVEEQRELGEDHRLTFCWLPPLNEVIRRDGRGALIANAAANVR